MSCASLALALGAAALAFGPAPSVASHARRPGDAHAGAPPRQLPSGADDVCGDGSCGGALHLLSLRAEAHRQSKHGVWLENGDPSRTTLPPETTLPPGVTLAPPGSPLPAESLDTAKGGIAGSAGPQPQPTTSFIVPFAIALVVLVALGVNLALRDATAVRSALASRGWAAPAVPKEQIPVQEYILLPSNGREVVAEFFGAFFATFASSMLGWSGAFNSDIAPQLMNGMRGLPPPPLRPPSALNISVMTGLLYVVTFQIAPGCSLNPLFALLMMTGGVRSKGLTAMCIAGQFVGMLLAHTLTYAVLRTPMQAIADLGKSGDFRTMENAQIFGVMYPPDFVPNYQAFLFTVLGSVLTVIVMMPNFALKLRHEPQLHPAMQRLIIGASIMVTTGVFFQAGLGGPPNPLAALPAALVLSAAGWPREIWTAHNHIIWIGVFAPVVGFVLGCVVNIVYMHMLLDIAPPIPPHLHKASGQTADVEPLAAAVAADR